MTSVTPGTAPIAFATARREGRHAAPDLQDALPALAARVDAGELGWTGSRPLVRESGPARPWGPADFEPGDRVRYLSAWYEVLAVGPFGVTVRSGSRDEAGAWTAS